MPVALPKRTFERSTGCWNCKNQKDPQKLWEAKREGLLQRALSLAIDAPLGEADPRVKAIKTNVHQVDMVIAKGGLVTCDVGKTATGEPVGDLIQPTYLCEKWVAGAGSSIARAGGAMDTLPEELVDKVDGVTGDDVIKRFKVN